VHELSVAQELMVLCAQRVSQGQRMATVRIAVGELASIEPDLLEFAWQAVVAGTRHAAARLDITWHAARQTCAQCGDVPDRQPGSWMRLCPHCQQPLRVVGGDELDLLEVVPVAAFDDFPVVPLEVSS
jgi:hydrogenase nickel insertion protein HypA